MHALTIWLSAVIGAALLVGLSRLSRWFYWLTVPASLLWLIQIVGVCMIVVQNSAVYGERGIGYVLQNVCVGALPFVSLVVYGYYDFRYRRVA
jgi:hypothetical protein